MSAKISANVRQELVRALGERYVNGTKSEKTRILDEFVAVSGFHRKHAIRVLRGSAHSAPASEIQAATRPKIYDEGVRQALVVLWEASDRVCGKRLKALLPSLVAALERNGHLRLDDAVREKLVAMSAATVDRLLINTRAATTNRRRPAALSAVRRSIPIRTFADWKEPLPGFMEADLVAHCGEVNAGSYVNTLTLTDVSSGWTECSALVVREAKVVVESIERLREAMPFPLRGLDTDNGTEFMNDVLLKYCASHAIEFTLSRPYRKNDQAWVEQKNGSVVRRLVGYRRLQGLAAAAALSRLYAASRLFVNFFQPSFKLISKTRVGARVTKRYDLPLAPYARLLASNDVSVEMKNRLREVEKTLDPLRLLEEIRAMQHHLVALSDRSSVHTPPERDKDLTQFLAGLSGAWRAGEVRPTHVADLPKIRDWRTRKDPFETAWPTILSWLESEPDQT